MSYICGFWYKYEQITGNYLVPLKQKDGGRLIGEKDVSTQI